MKRLLVAVAAVLTFAWFGCGNDSGGGGDGGGNGPPQDKAWVRFGNFSPDTPAIDICVKQSATQTWGSPVLGTNGLSAGLAYPAMSRIIYIDPGTLDFRGVMPGGSCDTPIGTDLTQQTINAHGTYTLTAVGMQSEPVFGAYRLQQWIEQSGPVTAGKARMRFVNLIPNSPALEDGLVDGGTWVQGFTEAAIDFRHGAAGTGILDGYQDMDPNPALPLTIRASPARQNPDIYTAPINLRAGVITSVWAIGLLGGTGNQKLGYFVCDETPAVDGGTTTCLGE